MKSDSDISKILLATSRGMLSKTCKGSCINHLIERMNSLALQGQKEKLLSQIGAGSFKTSHLSEDGISTAPLREPPSSCITTLGLHWCHVAAQRPQVLDLQQLQLGIHLDHPSYIHKSNPNDFFAPSVRPLTKTQSAPLEMKSEARQDDVALERAVSKLTGQRYWLS